MPTSASSPETSWPRTCGSETVGTSPSIIFKSVAQMPLADIFNEKTLARLPGRHAIGHVRYSTAGGSQIRNAQPFWAVFFEDEPWLTSKRSAPTRPPAC